MSARASLEGRGGHASTTTRARPSPQQTAMATNTISISSSMSMSWNPPASISAAAAEAGGRPGPGQVQGVTATGNSSFSNSSFTNSSSSPPSASHLLHNSSPPSASHPARTSILHTHRQNHNSSKLPAFRFVDLNSKNSLALPMPLPPSFLQHIPPSPVSPKSGPNGSPASLEDPPITGTTASMDTPPRLSPTAITTTSTTSTTTNTNTHRHQHSKSQNLATAPAPTKSTVENPNNPHGSPARNRASTFQTSANSESQTPTATTKRPASFPDSPVAAARVQGSFDSVANSTPLTRDTIPDYRRAPASYNSNGIEKGPGPSPVLNTHRLQSIEPAQAAQPTTDKSTKEWAQGQRELLLPKSLQNSSPTDEKRTSVSSRPPVSFRNLSNGSSTGSVRVAPIRGFRSSGARRSLVLDMNARMRNYDAGEESSDPNQLDRTLRALEGHADDDLLQAITPPDSAHHNGLDGDDTGDVFMKIAREETSRHGPDDNIHWEEASAVSRVVRSAHRRPLSAAIPSYQPASPPRISRRLSDQRETSRSRSRQLEEESSVESMARGLTYRNQEREKTTYTSEEPSRSKITGAAPRPSPTTPRTLTFQEPAVDGSSYGRRRTSITESSSGVAQRNATYKQSNLSYSRTYNPSPLVPRQVEAQRPDGHHELSHGLEGTESTASTTAPSTVWDELDELKSRIHRLELTGKIPSTSGAAMSRVSDERPPTATTTVTTMSASPKRGSGSGAAVAADASSTTSSQRDAQPILLSAVTKSKPFLSADVYQALEAAASDALSLSSMMGTVGQPGPIASGASSIGGGSTVTDRQLRRKADSICRSLTELCLALSEEVAQSKGNAQQNGIAQQDTPTTPTINKSFAGLAAQRRPSIAAEATAPRGGSTTSPRAMTRLEERRNTMLNLGALPSPRFATAAPSTPTEPTLGAGRKSSLLIARTRRAATEEPEPQPGRQTSLLLRSRRAGTEEPEDGRKTSLLLRGRRGTLGDDDDESRFRAPSRATTEVAHVRGASQNYAMQSSAADPGLATSALPRRRLVPSTLNSRLVAPSTPTTTLAGRRYLERSTPERDGNSVADKLAEERGQRQYSLGQTALLNRTGSLNRRQQNRDSTITNISTSAQAGGYR